MTILQRLKQETLPWHAALEQRVAIERRLRDPASYRELLVAFFGFYAPLERLLLQTPGIQEIRLDLQERRKAPWLAQDLQALGVGPATTAECDDLPELPGAAAALGCLYVLEGATLGGQIVVRMLEPLNITPDRGGRFFHSYGDRVGPMWNAFRQAVTDFATTDERADRIVAAATDTFQRFDNWLAKRLTTAE